MSLVKVILEAGDTAQWSSIWLVCMRFQTQHPVHRHMHACMQTHTYTCLHTHRQKKSYNAVVNEKVTGVITVESVVLEGLSNQIDKRTEILSALREGHG